MFRETVHNGKKLHVTRVGLRIRLTRDHFHWGKLKVRQKSNTRYQKPVTSEIPNLNVSMFIQFKVLRIVV